MVGLGIGMIRFIWEFSYSTFPCGEEEKDDRPDIISKVHYLHFGIILFVITVAVAVVVSLMTEPIDDVHVSIEKLCHGLGRINCVGAIQ